MVRATEGGIVGVYSMGGGAPIKPVGFPEILLGFDNAGGYRDWQFADRPTNSDVR
jgi:hypothetical protein